MPVDLEWTGESSVELEGGLTLRTPGLTGHATVYPGQDDEVREAVRPGSVAIQEALARSDGTVRETIVLADTNEVTVAAGQRETTAAGEPAMIVEADPISDRVQVMLVTDESGVMTWHFAEPSPAEGAGARANGKLVFKVRQTVPPPTPGEAAHRSFVTSKILQHVVFPIATKVGGRVGGKVLEHFLDKWESKHRPPRLRTFTPDDYSAAGTALDAHQLRTWNGQRALLMIHGTNDQIQGSFGRMPEELVKSLYRRYEGRILGFDHSTLTVDPRHNVRSLLTLLPDDVDTTFDVITSSRGGLVARVLAERLGDPEFAKDLGRRTITVDKVVLQAVPNNGTPLVNPELIGTFIDCFTNIFSVLPDVPLVIGLEVVAALVRESAVNLGRRLDGLQAMLRGGEFLTWLNDRPTLSRNYFAMGADFEPTHWGVRTWADAVLDPIFRGPNDMVVPRNSPWEQNGGGAFPLPAASYHGFDRPGVNHGAYFQQVPTVDSIMKWLQLT